MAGMPAAPCIEKCRSNGREAEGRSPGSLEQPVALLTVVERSGARQRRSLNSMSVVVDRACSVRMRQRTPWHDATRFLSSSVLDEGCHGNNPWRGTPTEWFANRTVRGTIASSFPKTALPHGPAPDPDHGCLACASARMNRMYRMEIGNWESGNVDSCGAPSGGLSSRPCPSCNPVRGSSGQSPGRTGAAPA